MIKVKKSVIIELPAEEIFTYLTDLDNLVDWSSPVVAVRKISPGAMCVGATLRTTMRFLGRWMDITFEVVEFDPSRCLTIKSISGCAPCLFSYQFEPVEDGGTSVCLQTVIHSTGIMELAEPVVTRVARRQLEHDLLTLKDLLEASVPTSGSAG